MKLIDYSRGFFPNHSADGFCVKVEDLLQAGDLRRVRRLGDLLRERGVDDPRIVEADGVGHVMCAEMELEGEMAGGDSPERAALMEVSADLGLPVPRQMYVDFSSHPDDPVVGERTYRDLLGEDGGEALSRLFREFSRWRGE